jgi:hypothetical protein
LEVWLSPKREARMVAKKSVDEVRASQSIETQCS